MTAAGAAARPPKTRLVLGATVFALGWILTLAIVPLLAASSLPTSLVGIVVFVGPKVGVLGAIAIMGKPGFSYLKALIFGYLKPPAEVGPARYRIGMCMFVGALLFGFLDPYAAFFLPGYAARGIAWSLSIDLLLLASILVLGGDFWDKIRALFIRGAKVLFPAES